MTRQQVTPGETQARREIRDAIRARLDREYSGGGSTDTAAETLHQAISQSAAAPLIDSAADTLEISGGGVWEPLKEPHKWALFGNLRPSEAERLVQLTEAATDRAEQACIDAIIGELTDAAMEFLRQSPGVTLRDDVARAVAAQIAETYPALGDAIPTVSIEAD